MLFFILKLTIPHISRQLFSGEQFVIQNCENSNIFLFDYINTVTVDDCKGCKIFIGPTKVIIVARNNYEREY